MNESSPRGRGKGKAEVEAKIKEILAAQRKEDLARIKFWVIDDPTSPASFIGGTWERIEGRFIMGASDTYPTRSTGGSNTVPINKDNLPKITLDVYGIYQITETGNTIDTLTYSGQGANSGEWSKIAETGQVGKGIPLNILPPYYSMYIWRRVA